MSRIVCLHDEKDKAEITPWIMAILNADDSLIPFDEAHLYVEEDFTYTGTDGNPRVSHRINLAPEVLNRLLLGISQLLIPNVVGQFRYSNLQLTFAADMWVGVSATATLRGKEEHTWVEADDFTLALAKTLELWREKIKGEHGRHDHRLDAEFMKNVGLHLRKADYQMRMALSWLHQTGSPLSLKVGHAIATIREVRVALKEAEDADNHPTGTQG